MNIDKIKEAENKRQADSQANKEAMEQITSLLRQVESLWEKSQPAFNKKMAALMEEFDTIFKTHGFEKRPSSNSKKSIMSYGDKDISFELLTERDFNISDRTKASPIGYGFLIEPLKLGLNHNYNAFINSATGKVDFLPNRSLDLSNEIQSITDYISQLNVAIEKLDSWEFEIIPFDETQRLFKQKSFNQISEIIDALE